MPTLRSIINCGVTIAIITISFFWQTIFQVRHHPCNFKITHFFHPYTISLILWLLEIYTRKNWNNDKWILILNHCRQKWEHRRMKWETQSTRKIKDWMKGRNCLWRESNTFELKDINDFWIRNKRILFFVMHNMNFLLFMKSFIDDVFVSIFFLPHRDV